MRTILSTQVPALLLVGLTTACTTSKPAMRGGDLQQMAREVLRLPLVNAERGAVDNIEGVRSGAVVFSRRTDSRTYFVQDPQFESATEDAIFAGDDQEFLATAREILSDLKIPPSEIANMAVLTEKVQSARREDDRWVPTAARSARRFVEATRAVDGIPVFSSRAMIGLKRDRAVGSMELHWPELPDAVVREARRMREIVRGGWKPPQVADAVVESVDAGIIHSPAIGQVMDIYPAIRVIYAPTNEGVARKAVFYFNADGKRVPTPRTFAKPPRDDSPAKSRSSTSAQ